MGAEKLAEGVIGAIGRVIDDLFTSDEEREEARRLLYEIQQKPHILQAEINKIEAGHASVFVAGWRPFVGWVCGFGVGYHFVIRDLLAWLFSALGWDHAPPPEIQLGELTVLLTALLGLGGARTFERIQGVQRDRLKP